eukprot:TRINITY_DN917_c0_g1_i2.p1 TRINITY_DN917_c0_g1~~TRINITY_DN917_c0_g1_i2.p1  ORF type:complete len:106 (+),score=8.78 TRINITY_DN917_c0_g1_i2:84-401(+)
MKLTIEFSGGAELLFNKIKVHHLDTPETVKTLRDLVCWIRDNLLQERPDLFVSHDTVYAVLASHCDRRPGILVLVNDTDWELLGGIDYTLEEGDTIVFISTLHGG